MTLRSKTSFIFIAVSLVYVSGFAQDSQNDKTPEVNYKQVEVSKVVDAANNTTVHINSRSRNIEVKSWGQDKVKIVTTVDVEINDKTSNDDLFDKLGISVHSMNNRVEIDATSANTFNYPPSFSFSGDLSSLKELERLGELDSLKLSKLKGLKIDSLSITGLNNLKIDLEKMSKLKHINVTGSRNNNFAFSFGYNTGKKRTLIIYVPSGVKLDIDNRYSDVTLSDDFKNADITISNSTLDARKINNLILNSKYSTVNLGDVEDAEVEIQNGNFTAGTIQTLDMDSKYATIEYEGGKKLLMRSQNDDYNIETLQQLQGRKNYGDLRINKLTGSLELDGANADIRVRKLTPGVQKIKINDKYADIRLPVKDLSNYTVSFEGKYATVFAPFEKVLVKEGTPKVAGGQNDKPEKARAEARADERVVTRGHNVYNVRSDYSDNYDYNSKFTATVGDSKSGRTQFELICNNCSVDFK